MFIGIDCGTQGTKVLLWDEVNETVVATSYHVHHLISERNGQKEQHPEDWLLAIKKGVENVFLCTSIGPDEIRGIGVSGQQHGLVILDKNDDLIRPAKLWCDTECEPDLKVFLNQYAEHYGTELHKDIGIHLPVAFTLGKLAWLKNKEPENFKRIEKIFLPHDYINFFLTGNYLVEPGDASGTGYFNTRDKTWSFATLDLLSPELKHKMPDVIESHQPHGRLSEHAAAFLGLMPGTLISSGGGDNMMSAIGTGNIREGLVTMSLGTSGTLSTCKADQTDSGSAPDINSFCSSSGAWLPLISTMNVTNAINTYRQLMDIDIKDFDNYIKASKPGAEGLFSFPWLNGARLPNLPGIRGSISGITMVNFTKPHLMRSVVEGVTFNLCRGIDIFAGQGFSFSKIIVIGGGANSLTWCQMIADITGLRVSRPEVADAAALGAAIQANWCSMNAEPRGDLVPLASVLPEFLLLEKGHVFEPDPRTHEKYQKIYHAYHAEVEYLKKHYEAEEGI